MVPRKPSPNPPADERAFLAAYDPSEYPRPSVSVDVVLMTVTNGSLWTLLVKRVEHPYKGWWALPGGFVRMDESLDAAAARVLREKAGLDGVFVEQLYTFGEPGRDPRLRVITVTYYALVDRGRFEEATRGGEGVCTARLRVSWQGEVGGAVDAETAEGSTLRLAFDHGTIMGMAVKRIRGKLDYTPIGFQLLPDRFTLRELQIVHETIGGKAVNKDSFRRRMLASGLLQATGEFESNVEYRPAELYRFRAGSAV